MSACFTHSCPHDRFLEFLNGYDWYFDPSGKSLVVRYGSQPWETYRVPLRMLYDIQDQDDHFKGFAGTPLADVRCVLERHENVWLLGVLEIELTDYRSEDLKERIRQSLEHPLSRTFKDALHRLSRIAQNRGNKVKLALDFAPLSYSFVIENTGFHGGLIFHEPNTSGCGAPTFSVTLDTSGGWQVHT